MPNWSEILQHDGPAIWKTAYRILGNQADADECFQEACLAGLKISQTQTVQRWRPLLQRIATLRAMDRLRERYRRRQHEQFVESFDVPTVQLSPLEQLQGQETVERIRNLLIQLPAAQAEVFYLHAIEGWSYAECATQMDMTIDAVGVLLHRARKRLQEWLGPAEDISTSRSSPSVSAKGDVP